MNIEIGKDNYYSSLGISIGIISDLDIGTEFMRFLGDKRYDIGALYYILKYNTYNLEIEYICNNNIKKNITGNFLQVFVLNISHISHNCCINSDQKLDNDYVTLVLIDNN